MHLSSTNTSKQYEFQLSLAIMLNAFFCSQSRYWAIGFLRSLSEVPFSPMDDIAVVVRERERSIHQVKANSIAFIHSLQKGHSAFTKYCDVYMLSFSHFCAFFERSPTAPMQKNSMLFSCTPSVYRDTARKEEKLICEILDMWTTCVSTICLQQVA